MSTRGSLYRTNTLKRLTAYPKGPQPSSQVNVKPSDKSGPSLHHLAILAPGVGRMPQGRGPFDSPRAYTTQLKRKTFALKGKAGNRG